MSARNKEKVLVYVGTYTRGESEGIYVYDLNTSSGALTLHSVTGGVENPSFLAIDPLQRYLYAVNDVEENLDGNPGGTVSSFSIEQDTGELTYLNRQPSHGTTPAHLSVDETSSVVLVANYGSGSLSVFPVGPDGRLEEATDVVQHQGSSVNPERQNGPHAHCVTLDPANRYVFAADLGTDRIMAYRLNPDQGKLILHDESSVGMQAGAGPRHLTFHPGGRYAYLINELDSTLTAFTYDGASGSLRPTETLPAIPDGFRGTNYSADVCVSPSGRFVYGSNRGHDSIVIFAIDEGTGKLAYVGHEPTHGEWPRNIAIDPSGGFLLAANQNSDSIVAFRIDRRTGGLTPTGHVTEVPQPVCMKLMVVSGSIGRGGD